MKTLLYLLAFASVVPAFAAQPAAISGHVRLSDGQPVAGAQVALFDLADLRAGAVARAITDDAGHFAFARKASGGSARPDGFRLGANYPNPFNPSTIIPYQLPTATHVRLEVFNLLGQRVATLVDGTRSAGAHTAVWDATDAAGQAVGAGVYIYRLSGGGATQSRRMVLIDGQAGRVAAPSPNAGWTTAERPAEPDAPVYGLTVLGPGLVPHVDPAFRVEAGMTPVEVVLAAPARAKRLQEENRLLGDVDGNGRVDMIDALLVAVLLVPLSADASIIDLSTSDIIIDLGDVNGDGVVNLTDAYLIGVYSVNPSDRGLPSGIGEPVSSGSIASDDHSDTRAGATGLDLGSSRDGRISTRTDIDFFEVGVFEPGWLTVYTTGPTDTRGELGDGRGSRLASDDDSGVFSNFLIENQPVTADFYYVKISGVGLSTGDYIVHAVFKVKAEDYYSDTREGATGLDLGSSRDGRIQSGDDIDYFQVQVSQSGWLTVYTTGSTDTEGRLENSRGSYLADDSNSGSGRNFRIESRQLSAGTYYVKVEGASSRSTGDYTIHTSFEADDHSNTEEGATFLPLGSSLNGRISGPKQGSSSDYDVDYFQVQVSQSGRLTVYTRSSRGSSIWFRLSGTLFNDRTASISVSRGTYYIRVSGDSGRPGDYTIHASFEADD